MDKVELARQITCRCFKVAAFEAATVIRERLDDLDEQARMETFLNLRISAWLRATGAPWGWMVAFAEDLRGLDTLGAFAAFVERHLVDLG